MRVPPAESDRSRPTAAAEPAVAAAAGAAKFASGSESARRLLRILLSFTRHRHTLSAKDLAALTEIPLPSAYRYVGILRESGLLVGDDQGGYHLSARFIALAQAAEAAESLIDIADPVMRALAESTAETVLLVRLVNDAAVCIHRIESSQRLRISFEPGQPLALDRGASGRLLLASLSADRLHAALESVRARDPAGEHALEADVALAAERGWATSDSEIDPGIWAAAAAVYDKSAIVAALSVPSPLVRAPAALQEKMLAQVRHAADEISRLLRARSAEGLSDRAKR